MVEQTKKNATSVVANSNDQGLTLNGTIEVLNDTSIIKANLTVHKEEKTCQYRYEVLNDGNISENCSGEFSMLDETRSFSRQTIEEFKTRYLVQGQPAPKEPTNGKGGK